MDKLKDKPSLRHLLCINYRRGKEIRIIDKVSARWKELGAMLGVETHYMDNIQKKPGLLGVTDFCQEMLTMWLKGEVGDGKPATWKELLTALECIKKKELAREIKDFLISQGKCDLLCVSDPFIMYIIAYFHEELKQLQ